MDVIKKVLKQPTKSILCMEFWQEYLLVSTRDSYLILFNRRVVGETTKFVEVDAAHLKSPVTAIAFDKWYNQGIYIGTQDGQLLLIRDYRLTSLIQLQDKSVSQVDTIGILGDRLVGALHLSQSKLNLYKKENLVKSIQSPVAISCACFKYQAHSSKEKSEFYMCFDDQPQPRALTRRLLMEAPQKIQGIMVNFYSARRKQTGQLGQKDAPKMRYTFIQAMSTEEKIVCANNSELCIFEVGSFNDPMNLYRPPQCILLCKIDIEVPILCFRMNPAQTQIAVFSTARLLFIDWKNRHRVNNGFLQKSSLLNGCVWTGPSELTFYRVDGVEEKPSLPINFKVLAVPNQPK